uniref:Uncharacterized protein n=1 Tax=Romanomermis culicivorax TaxID=13658 RepID=A0A915HLX0_ROMCU
MLVKNNLDSRGKTAKRFTNNTPGDDWARSFLARHKTALSTRMANNVKNENSDEDALDENEHLVDEENLEELASGDDANSNESENDEVNSDLEAEELHVDGTDAVEASIKSVSSLDQIKNGTSMTTFLVTKYCATCIAAFTFPGTFRGGSSICTR